MKNIQKAELKTIKYFELFPLLNGLENERPGIKNRIWEWMCDQVIDSFKPKNDKISIINLFFFGVGDEYDLDYLKKYPEDLERSKNIHSDAFNNGNNQELRLDLNLILYVYQDEIGEDIEMFHVIPKW